MRRRARGRIGGGKAGRELSRNAEHSMCPLPPHPSQPKHPTDLSSGEVSWWVPVTAPPKEQALAWAKALGSEKDSWWARAIS